MCRTVMMVLSIFVLEGCTLQDFNDPARDYPEYQVRVPVEFDTLASPMSEPEWPSGLPMRRLVVQAQFVVDTMGRVDMSTYRVLYIVPPAAERAVENFLHHLRFIPAVGLNHRKVRQVVQWSFVFEPPMPM